MVFSSHHDVIKQSQRRSLQYGVTSTLSESDYLESQMLKLIKERDEQMVRTIIPNIEKFIPMVFAHHSTLILSNKDGYILHSQGDAHFLDHASKIQLLEGAGWREEVRGTNAIGTAIVEKSPVYVLGDEHFCQVNQTLYCAASPIFDPTGEILAVLDVSGYAGDFHGIARQMEDWLLLGHEKSQLVIEVTDRHQRYLFAFDDAGHLSGTNREARKFLSTTWSDHELACETTLRKLFPCHQYDMSVLFDRRTPTIAMSGSHRFTIPMHREIFCQDENLEKALQLASRAAMTEMNVLIDGLVQITLPPLRERKDKLALSEFLLEGIAREMNVSLPVLSASTKEILNAYQFPGNVRELSAVLRQGVFLADQGVIHPMHLPLHMTAVPASLTMKTRQCSLPVENKMRDCEQALVDFYQWATENQHRFYGKVKNLQMGDCMGRWDGKEEWGFIAIQQTNLKEFLSVSGYSPLKVLTEWRNNGWIETAGGRKGFTKFVKTGSGSGTSLVVILRNALEKVVNVSQSVNG